LGKTGFIASHLCYALSKKHNVKCISHQSIDDIEGNFDAVINCCINPSYRNESYKEENDFDLKAARKFGGRFVMISSRKVYGTSDAIKLYNEYSPINPVDYYSENKSITEEKLRGLKNDHLIFRASNVFGFEPNRNSFLGFCIDQLIKNNNISYNVGFIA
jgi:dTDP-4-dehydrorhamnose reductase